MLERRYVRTTAEDAAKTDIQVLSELSNMLSEEKRKKNWDGESALLTRRNGQEQCGNQTTPSTPRDNI